MSTPSVVLRAAADLLDRHGWVRRYYHIPHRGYCAVGSLRRSASQVWASNRDQVLARAEIAVALEVSERMHVNLPVLNATTAEGRIARWNDAVASSGEEVAELFRTVADRVDRVP